MLSLHRAQVFLKVRGRRIARGDFCAHPINVLDDLSKEDTQRGVRNPAGDVRKREIDLRETEHHDGSVVHDFLVLLRPILPLAHKRFREHSRAERVLSEPVCNRVPRLHRTQEAMPQGSDGSS